MLVGVYKNMPKSGMYVESVDCAAFKFSRRRFLIKSQQDIEQIRSTGADRVFINTEFGICPDEGSEDLLVDGAVFGITEATVVTSDLRQSVEVVANAFEAARCGVEIDAGALLAVVDRLEVVACDAPDILVRVSRLKASDETTSLHSVAVSSLMMRVGQAMDLNAETISRLGPGGLLHDIWKILIPSEILSKPGKLTADEIETVRLHRKLGHDVMTLDGRFSYTVLGACLNHHELVDGSGYPFGLCGAQLGMHVRMTAVCDVFDALTTVRPHKNSWPIQRAIGWLYDNATKYEARIIGRLSDAIRPRNFPMICVRGRREPHSTAPEALPVRRPPSIVERYHLRGTLN